jgi:hypothetical protein
MLSTISTPSYWLTLLCELCRGEGGEMVQKSSTVEQYKKICPENTHSLVAEQLIAKANHNEALKPFEGELPFLVRRRLIFL